jgi:hypothetical protein
MAKFAISKGHGLGDNEIELTVTLRGEPTACVGAIVNGLPPEALQQMSDAINRHLAKEARAARSAAAKRSAATRTARS